jgi:hypothetical protein
MAAFLGPLVGSYIGKVQKAHQQDMAKQFQEYQNDMRTYQLALDSAASKGLWDDVANITNLMNERTEELPGAKKATKEGLIGNIGEIGKRVVGLMKGLKQRQQQQQQQRAIAQAYDATAPGAPGAAPGAPSTTRLQFPFMPPPDGTSTTRLQFPFMSPAAAGGTARPTMGVAGGPGVAPLPGMPPLRQRSQELFARLGPAIQRATEAQQAREFEAQRRETGMLEADKEARQQKLLKDRTAYFQTSEGGGMDPKSARESAFLSVFGKEPGGGRYNMQRMYYTVPGSDEVKEGLYDPRNPGTAFDITTGAALAPGSWKPAEKPKPPSADELGKAAAIILAKKGVTNPTPEQKAAAVQEAGTDLFRNKFVLPEERLQLQRDAVRYIPGEEGMLPLPTHLPGARRGVPGPAMPPRQPGAPTPAAAGGMAAPGGVIPYPAGFTPKLSGPDRTRKTNAEVIMQRSGDFIATIQRLQGTHPEWFGATGPAWAEIQRTFGTLDPDVGTLKGSMDGLVGFLPSLHSFRSRGILDEWKKTLDNPLRNPSATIATIREVAKAAQELRDVILRRSTAPMTAEGEENKAGATAGAGAGPTSAAQDYMRKRGIQ